MSFAHIESRDLTMRVPAAADLPAIARLMNDPAIAEFYGGVRYPCTPLSVTKWYRELQRRKSGSTSLHYTLVLRSNPRMIVGGAHITVTAGERWPVIGYWIGAKYRKRRLASQVVRALIAKIFEETEIEGVMAPCSIRNLASQRTLRAGGMRRIGFGWITFPDPRRKLRAAIFLVLRKHWKPPRRMVPNSVQQIRPSADRVSPSEA